jgi:hypothetical protein
VARIRTIKPELAHSASLGRVSRDARLAFVLLFTVADDAGRVRGEPRMLAGLLFPYDDDAKALIEGWLDELVREGSIVRYRVNGDLYLAIPGWSDHQRIDRPSKSKIPGPDAAGAENLATDRDTSSSPRESSRDEVTPSKAESYGDGEGDSTKAREASSEEGNGMEGKGEDRAHAGGSQSDPTRRPGWRPRTYHAGALMGRGGFRIDLPAGWAGRIQREHRLSDDDVQSFKVALNAEIGDRDFDDDGKRLQWLDSKFTAWQRARRAGAATRGDDAYWKRWDAEQKAAAAAVPKRTPEQIAALLKAGKAQAHG